MHKNLSSSSKNSLSFFFARPREKRMGFRFFGGRNNAEKMNNKNNKNKEVMNEHSGLLVNRDQRPVGGRSEYVDLNEKKNITNDGKIKYPRGYTKVGNFVLHHHRVAKEDLLGAKKSERSASRSEMNATSRGYPAMM